jgi:hypothetical protein
LAIGRIKKVLAKINQDREGWQGNQKARQAKN